MFYQKEDVKLQVEPVPSVDLRCRDNICEQDMSTHSSKCYLRNTREDSDDYLWLVNYFQKYKNGGGVWGEWIQDSLNMRVVYEGHV